MPVNEKFYVGQILEVLPNNKYKINFLRASGKFSKSFYFPNVEDICEISFHDIICILNSLVNLKSTSRQKCYINFDVDFTVNVQ